MQKRVWVVLFLLAVAAPACARAGETTVGIAITGTHGTHRESGGAATAPLVPAPVVALSHRFKRFEFQAEGLPPVGPIPVSNNGLGMQSIALSYVDGTVRYWNSSQTFAVGLGETLYNQRSKFLDVQTPYVQEHSTNFSRVAGARYEVAARVPLAGRNLVQAQFALNPAMHGRFIFQVDERWLSNHGWRENDFTQPPQWERGSQVDADVRVTHSFGTFAVSYGLRYLNYTAKFTTRPVDRFADSNSFLMPYIAIERSWGH